MISTQLVQMQAVLEHLAFEAAARIAQIAARPFEHSNKNDGSPVTEADAAGEAIILAGLAEHFPDIDVVAEERVSDEGLPASVGKRFFLVDPLDGTKEFINHRPDYTVNIALIEDGEPVLGVVVAPARNVAWCGWSDIASGVTLAEKLTLSKNLLSVTDRAPIAMRDMPASPVIVASRSHVTPETEAFLGRYPDSECVSVGSSLKFCLLAEGVADIYPRFGPTMEWDTAAGHAVICAAGGQVWSTDGPPLAYAKSGFFNTHFIAANAKADPRALF